MFLYHKWTELNINTRHKLAAQFGFKQKAGMHVQDNQIISDGYLIKDVEEALNIDAIQEYIGTHETDMLNLWHMLIAKIEGRPIEPINIDTTSSPPQKEEVALPRQPQGGEAEPKPKRGRPFKNAKEETPST